MDNSKTGTETIKNHRISNLSSDQQTFNSSAPTYENALCRSNYDFNLQYNATPSSKIDDPNTESCTSSQPKRKRHRNILWFNPPYSKNVVTNIGKTFLQLIDKHFPKSSRLHKIFNRNSIKISYSCMKNVKTTISNHNTRIRSTEPTATEEINCNCRKKDECPLQKKCLTRAIVYQAEVKSHDNGETKRYIGVTAREFKHRYRNHKKSFELQRYANETELSKHIWKLKRSGRPYNTTWSILKKAVPYTSGRPRCNLCLQEKLLILKSRDENLLNKRSEIFSKCVHQKQFLAGNVVCARESNINNPRARAQSRHQTTKIKQYLRTMSPDDRSNA